jgi:hypothetical protein
MCCFIHYVLLQTVSLNHFQPSIYFNYLCANIPIRTMKRVLLLISIFMAFATVAIAQSTGKYGFDDGCFSTVDFAAGPSLGDYGDKSQSICITHNTPVADNLFIDLGLGINRHQRYKATLLPLFAGVSYYFLDKPFSPFISMKIGTYIYLSTSNVDTKQKYSIQKSDDSHHFFFAPSLGAKLRLTNSFGIQAFVSDEQYIMYIYNPSKKNYHNHLVGSLSFSLGIYFQIKGF